VVLVPTAPVEETGVGRAVFLVPTAPVEETGVGNRPEEIGHLTVGLVLPSVEP